METDKSVLNLLNGKFDHQVTMKCYCLNSYETSRMEFEAL